MSTCTIADAVAEEDFTPHIVCRHEDGSFDVHFSLAHKPLWSDNFVGQMLCLIEDGVAVALVEFEGSVDDAGRGLVAKGSYPNGVPHPEYFDALTAYDICDMLNDGRLVSLDYKVVQNGGQVYRIVDMRDGKDGNDYFLEVPNENDVQVVLMPNVLYALYENDAPPPPLSSDEALVLVADRSTEDATIFYLDHSLAPGEWVSWDDFYERGFRLLIEDITATFEESVARSLVEQAAEA